jgi:hypothetical protein
MERMPIFLLGRIAKGDIQIRIEEVLAFDDGRILSS